MQENSKAVGYGTPFCLVSVTFEGSPLYLNTPEMYSRRDRFHSETFEISGELCKETEHAKSRARWKYGASRDRSTTKGVCRTPFRPFTLVLLSRELCKSGAAEFRTSVPRSCCSDWTPSASGIPKSNNASKEVPGIRMHPQQWKEITESVDF